MWDPLDDDSPVLILPLESSAPNNEIIDYVIHIWREPLCGLADDMVGELG